MNPEPEVILKLCNSLLNDRGFECYPFQIGWYNSTITNDRYKLNYDDSTLAVLAISVPGMFESTFLPWLRARKENLSEVRDPIDQCMVDVFDQFRKNIPSTLDMDIIHDFEMNQGRYPRILMNTAGHVSGAARYFQKSDLSGHYSDKKLFGVSVHSKYGGWFAFRVVMIFPNLSIPNLQLPRYEMNNRAIDDVFNLLRSFTYDWRTSEWRDAFVHADEQYSDMQKEYFSRTPGERKALVIKWISEGKL